MDNIVEKTDVRMQKTLDNLIEEFGMIRAGRANPKLLDKISVSYYGALTPLRQVANISVQEGRTLLIQPYDRNLIKEINKEILSSDIGITPSDDGQAIRLVFPELSGERRKELTKEISKKAEGAKVAIRNIRRDSMDEAKKAQKAGEITEDDQKTLEAKVQKSTDRFIKMIEDETEKKSAEIMTV